MSESRYLVLYHAHNVTQTVVAKDRVGVAGGVAWQCNGTTCVAEKGTSRSMRICRELQRDVGEIVGFTTKGEALAEDKLAKCNG